MGNKFFPDRRGGRPISTKEQPSHVYNKRQCPVCGGIIYGMPGGRDAHCPNCGFKDPCCSD